MREAEEVQDRMAGVLALRVGSRVAEADAMPVVPQTRAKARPQLGEAYAVRVGESHLGRRLMSRLSPRYVMASATAAE